MVRPKANSSNSSILPKGDRCAWAEKLRLCEDLVKYRTAFIVKLSQFKTVRKGPQDEMRQLSVLLNYYQQITD